MAKAKGTTTKTRKTRKTETTDERLHREAIDGTFDRELADERAEILASRATAPTTATEEETRNARIAASASTRSRLAEGANLTTGQATFFRNRGMDAGRAALALGMDSVKALALIMAPETLGADRDLLARQASTFRSQGDKRADYFTTRGVSRHAWNNGAPRATREEVRALTLEGIALAGLSIDGI